jgi:regulator of protease activity HflC (stomatin/prohibitin superfamily)
MVALTAACTRIETGEVGIRVDMSKQIQSGELMPGSWNQTLVGEVITFPVKDIPVTLENKAPLTADNSALADFDITVVYNINPSSVAELYSTKSRAFHAVDKGDTFLMYNYITTLVNNASYKAVRQYKSLEIADNRQKIEGEIRETVTNTLKEEKLDGSVSVSLVQIRNVQPNAEILAAATQYVKSQNEIKIKENEVKLAKLESERMAALATNSTQSIAYIQAQAELNYSEAAKAGKINTIIVPREFKGMINVSK